MDETEKVGRSIFLGIPSQEMIPLKFIEAPEQEKIEEKEEPTSSSRKN